MIFSCIIPASKKDSESQKLKDLIASIKVQDFPQDQIEILVITEGDSEQAKAIGIRRARGEICAMFCADNYVVASRTFTDVFKIFYSGLPFTGVYGRHYAVRKDDNSLNRYFSLVGGNDPICFYLGKNDNNRIKGTIVSSIKTTLPISISLTILLFLFSSSFCWILIVYLPDLVMGSP